MPLDLDERQEWKNNASKLVEFAEVVYLELCKTKMPNELVEELTKIWFASTMSAISMPAFPDFSALFNVSSEEEEEEEE